MLHVTVCITTTPGITTYCCPNLLQRYEEITMPSLTIVLDYVAGLRQIMRFHSPDPVAAAIMAQLAGADGIAVRLREDREYIQERDLRLLRKTIHSKLILQAAPTSEMTGFALDIKPERVILVPPMEVDTPVDNGLDLMVHGKHLVETIDTLQSNGILVGICIPAEPEQSKLAHQIRADWIQIHAGKLSAASSSETQSHELDRIIDTVKMARKLRLRISVGHGLDERLIKLFKNVSEIDEFSMGRSIIAKAVLNGMDTVVRDTIEMIRTL
jgi:pyridoxine 5-phosphate synthase